MTDFKTRLTIYLARITFGLFLPAYLVWLMLFSHFSMQQHAEISQSFSQLGFALDHLEEYHQDQVFFHSIFQKSFESIDSDDFSEKRLNELVDSFKQRFKNRVEFLVYHGDGKVNRRLTREKRFSYLLKTMFETMHLVKDAYLQNPLGNPEEIEGIEKRLNLLRSYFGEFLVADELFEPLRDKMRGSCLLSSKKPEKRMLWFYPGRKFSLVCFIHQALLNRYVGAKMLIRKHNLGSDRVKLACLKPIEIKGGGLPRDDADAAELVAEVQKFMKHGESDRQSAKYLVHLRQVSFDLVIFSYLDKSSIINPTEVAAGYMLSGLRWLLLVAFLFYCFSLRFSGLYLTVKNKMLLLFVFANGLPFLITVSTGYEYFSEKKKELVNSAHQESVRVLREFDLRYPEITDAIADRFNLWVSQRNRKYGREIWPQAEIDELHLMVKEMRPSEAVLMKYDGEYTFYLTDTATNAEKLIAEILKRAVLFFNTRKEKDLVNKDSLFDQVTSDEVVLNFFLKMLDRFTILGVGNNPRHSYIKFVGDNEKSDFWAILGISWSRSQLMQRFIMQRIEQSQARVRPRIFAVMDPSGEKVYSNIEMQTPITGRLMRQTVRRKMIAAEDVVIDGKKYLFTSVIGNEISGAVLVALYPQQIIEDQVIHLKMMVWLLILVILLVLTSFVKMFSSRLLTPVAALGDGVAHLRKRDFNYSVAYSSEDELGQLVKVFNDAVENMKELAIGTSVQESLLPSGEHSCARVELFARSVFMTRMGGDYFDYFEIDNNRMVMFFGDVAGHGIPAAMIMAMVKAVITGNRYSFVSPADLLTRANQCLLQLKKRGWRRMMTAQAMLIDCESGEFLIANAGHSYPYLVRKSDETVNLIKVLGMPLGSAGKAAFKEVSGQIQAGDTLVLYSDGIIEARSADSELFGYERFEKMLLNAWSDNLQEYWENIMAINAAWAQVQDDDLTFMLIRFKEKV